MKNTQRSAISYLRASTDPSKQKNSLAVQRRSIAAFAKANGLNLVAEFAEYGSGRTNDRQEFQRAVTAAKESNYILIVSRIDRIARNLEVFSEIADVLPLIRATEIGNQPLNLLVISILLALATSESKAIGDRVKATIAHLKEVRGKDFKWGNLTEEARMKGRGVVAANAATFNAGIRKTCRELRLAGYDTVGALAERLNEIGVTTRRGKAFSYHNLHRVLATA